MPFHAEQQARQPSCLLTSSSDALSDEEGALGSSSSRRRCLRLAQQAFGNNRKPLFQYMRQEPGSHISFIKRGFHPPPPGSGELQTHLLPSTAPSEASLWTCLAPFTLGRPIRMGARLCCSQHPCPRLLEVRPPREAGLSSTMKQQPAKCPLQAEPSTFPWGNAR